MVNLVTRSVSTQRDVKLSPVKNFSARLLRYSRRFATNPEYLFHAQFIIAEQKKGSDSIIYLFNFASQADRAPQQLAPITVAPFLPSEP